MRRVLLISCLLIPACGPQPIPQTPAQALVDLRAAEAGLLTLFNQYASQRPFCGDTGAKAPPLCADRQIVIDGSVTAQNLHEGLAVADKIIQASGAGNASWQALVAPKALLERFQNIVDGVKR